MSATPPSAERALILAPQGRDAPVARGILREASIQAEICQDLAQLLAEIRRGAELAIITEEALAGVDVAPLTRWVSSQPPWSDFPFVVLTRHGGGLERNPTAARLTGLLGNVAFLERPFHPTTLVSVVQTALRGRQRQYEARRLNEDLESRVQERTAELAAANRQLLAQIDERERVESTLRQMQRLEAVGQLTSGVAHDFNNLLTVILGNISFLERGLAQAGLDGAMERRLGYMRIAAERGAKLTDQLLAFSRRQRLEPRTIDLNVTLADMHNLLQSTMGGRIRIETRMTDGLWLALADPTQVELAVLNLAINARDAMEAGGTLSVTTANVTRGPPASPEQPAAGDYVEICVRDTGTGMTEEVRAKALEPFFTTKEVGKGSGLGLSQVLGFAKQSGGGVSIDTAPGRGTAICIYLPRTREAAAAPDGGPAAASATVRAARILVVDDDNAVREITAAMLRELGHRVLEAGSGGAALELLESEPGIELMVVDFAMPGMNGAELARHARQRRPGLPLLFVTGFIDRAALSGIADAQILGKPFGHDELARKIASVLHSEAQAAGP
ncbi:response regulator [Inquilinus sp.]|uniref:response regulator n=1 Tax=Inquilinus sp. TaxID=1932117 RepID=UPI0031E09A8D